MQNHNGPGGGQSPDALRLLEAAARDDGTERAEQGPAARSDTAPLPDNSERKAETATRILRAGIDHDPSAAEAAVKSNPDPRNPRPAHSPGDTSAQAGPEDAGVESANLQHDIAKLTQAVSELVQHQAASARGKITDAMGTAGNALSQSASTAQDQLVSIEAEIGSRIKSNPWTAVAIAGLAGLLIAKLSS
jgi:ElaB/YqjD/DUF883 family membrane-anchored ribosome-binding protein